jgi:large subunit ribosomal protein L14
MAGIQKETKLVVADNSGAKMIKCFHLAGSTGKRTASLGDIIIAAVKEATPGAQVKKGDKVTAVIVRQHGNYRRDDGSYIKFDDNAAVIIKSKDDATPVGSRVFGPVARELRTLDKERFAKILSLAPEVV